MSGERIGGRYELLRKLAQGGMAEVFLARQTGAEGFEKLVVVKRILPHFAQNPEFVSMFLDEARTAADLRHPNIVQMNDIGQDGGTWFIAMEYLHGHDLAHMVKRGEEKALPLPLPLTLRIILDAAAGLHAAHTKKDLQGRPLQIVHRDVSPQNLFVTWDGTVKLLDFGIARAARRSTQTDAGIVKGKYSYLSPEQLDGAALDARSDLFALGIVLWELVAKKRLFNKPSDAEVLRAVMECKIPSVRDAAPECPAELEQIILKVLARNPHDRYADCGAFAAALEDFTEGAGLNRSSTRVGQYLRKLWPENQDEAPLPPSAGPLDSLTRASTEKPTRPDARSRQPGPPAQDFLSEVQRYLGDAPAAGPKTNLVPPLSPLIGRTDDLAQLSRWLEEGARLVTITGFGGMGKSRLAIELALQKVPQLADFGGVWWVDLADARTAEAIVRQVTQTVNLDAIGDTAEGTVTRAGRTLAARARTLLVLDNFEQLVPHARATVGEWLKAAPNCAFVVTSREALRLPEERVHTLSPLREAVPLFFSRMERLGLVPPAEAQELRAIEEICQRLDGLPLAIELAAARMTTMKAREIREKLGARFELLGGKDASKGRHGTLWNTIDWSWQMLPPAEQAALSQLSVFRGGFTLDAAEGVLAVKELSGSAPVFELVETLHRKSLLRPFVAREQPGVVRLSMFESIHEFASEKLIERGDVFGSRARHAQYYLKHADQWAEEVYGHQGAEKLDALSVERENLFEIYERALQTLPPNFESAQTALRAIHALEPLLTRKGPFSSHLALLDSAIQLAVNLQLPASELARAHQSRGNVQRHRGKLKEALEQLTEARRLATLGADLALESRVLSDLGLVQYVSGDLSSAEQSLKLALQIAHQAKDGATEVRTLSSLAILHVARKELFEALVCCDEALPKARERGDALSEARLLGTLGTLYLEEGRLELARAYFGEAVQKCRQVGETRLHGFFLGKLGWAQVESKMLQPALNKFEEALSAVSEVGDMRHEGLLFGYRASAEALNGQLHLARVSLSAAQVRLDSVKDPLLLTAQALRRMHVDLLGRGVSAREALDLLKQVNVPTGSRPSRVLQSEEVRAAARLLERAVADVQAAS